MSHFNRLTTLQKTLALALGVVVIAAAVGGWQIYSWVSARGDDTWVYQGGNWTDVSSRPAPGVRTDAAMAYDPSSGLVVLFGGRPANSNTNFDDTWTWDGHAWHQLSLSIHPPQLASAVMAFDLATRQLVLFGGFDSTDTSSPIAVQTPAPGCPASVVDGKKVPPPASCFTPLGTQAGQSSESESTWSFASGAWHRLATAHSPSAREGAAMAFDSRSARLILFGGSTQIQGEGGSPMLGDTWAFDGSDWTQVDSPAAPTPRAYAGMVIDAAGLLLFGGSVGGVSAGFGAGQGLGDTWRWTGASWQRVTPSHSPGPRYEVGLAADPINGSVLLFGGQLGCSADHGSAGCSTSPYLAETWTWDGRDWTQVATGPFQARPRARSGATLAAFGRGRYVLFGGQDPHQISLV
jgi:hypothetical protein